MEAPHHPEAVDSSPQPSLAQVCLNTHLRHHSLLLPLAAVAADTPPYIAGSMPYTLHIHHNPCKGPGSGSGHNIARMQRSCHWHLHHWHQGWLHQVDQWRFQERRRAWKVIGRKNHKSRMGLRSSGLVRRIAGFADCSHHRHSLLGCHTHHRRHRSVEEGFP